MRDFKICTQKSVRRNRPKKSRKPLPWPRILGRATILALAVGVLWAAPFVWPVAVQKLQRISVFSIQGIEVVEAGRVSSQEVLALSELSVGDGLFDLDLQEVGRRIEADPWISEALVQRIFPNRLLIRVKEHRPRVIVNLGYLYYLDASGDVFKVLSAGDDLDFPVITGMSRELLESNPQKSRQDLLLALALVDELSDREIFNLNELSEIHLEPEGGLTLYTLNGGVPVRMGSGDFGSKLDRLERIYKDLKMRLYAIKYIDLNISHRLIVKIAEPEIGKG